jgi:DNA repair exonuclease SbcCD ATPase subunit
MTIRAANRSELEGRLGQIQQAKKEIHAVIQRHKVTERNSIESGDGRTALASRKTIAAQEEELERLGIEENAIEKRLQEYRNNKPDAEKLKAEIEQLHNQTAAEHVSRIINAQSTIVENLNAIEVISNSIEDLATQYLMLCGESLYVPTITVPWIVREFARSLVTSPVSREITRGLQPVEPYRFGR